MKIDSKKVVTMTYVLSVYGKDESLNVLDQRDNNNPIDFIQGQGLLLPAVEKAIESQMRGFKKTLILFPKDAFGEFLPELEQWLDVGQFPKGLDVQVGMKFQTQGLNHEVIPVMIKKIEEDRVLVDGNHPLAGLKIKFDIEIVRVREATEEELLSGEVRSKLH